MRALVRIRRVSLRAAAAITGALAALAMAVPAMGGSAPLLTPEQVLARSESVVQARVTKVSVRWSGTPRESGIATDVEFTIDRLIADQTGLIAERRVGETFTLSFFGGSIDGETQTAHGVPSFKNGDRVFLMLSTAEKGAISPLVGCWQGLYRVDGVDVQEKVVQVVSCCGATRPVGEGYFDQPEPSGDSVFSAEEFATELQRALPIARGQLRLRAEQPGVKSLDAPLGRADMRGFNVERVIPGRGERQRDVSSEVAVAMNDGFPAIQPVPGDGFTVQSDGAMNPTGPSERFGFFSGAQSRPIVFNVPPAMGAFGDAFKNSQGYWNVFAPDLFRFYANPNNDVGWPNDRNELGFLSQAQMTNLYNFNWGTSYGVCISRSSGGNIEETDILMNSDSYIWTNDQQVGRTGSERYFPTVAVHELGHSFGLQHQWDSNPNATWLSVMNYYSAALTYNVGYIYADDALAVQTRYGYSLFINDMGIYMYANTGGISGGVNGTTDNITFANVVRGTAMPINNVSIENSGTTTGSRTVNWWLCPENGNFNSAVYLGSTVTPVVPGTRSARISASPTVPGSVAPGNYYLAGQFTAGDDWGWNNTAWTRQTILVQANTPGNDSYLDAVYISSFGGTYFGTTLGATSSVAQPCGGTGNYTDVWYRITPQFDGRLEVDTCGSGYDTVLSVHDTGLTSLVCNDDASSSSASCNGSRQSYLGLNVSAGLTYYVRVGGFNGGTGDFVLNVRVRPSNDSRCKAGPFGLSYPTAPIGSGVVYGTTVGATASGIGDYASCNPLSFTGEINVDNRPDVWYEYTAECTGTVYVEGSPVDQVWLTVYGDRACLAFTAPTLLGCSSVYTGNLFSPGMTINAVAGTSYLIRVRTIDYDTNFTLNFRPGAVNDSCAGWFGSAPVGVPVSVATPGVISVDTRCATPSNGLLIPAECSGTGVDSEGANDLWYTLQVQNDGELQITRCNGNYFPAVVLYNQCSDNPFAPGQATPIACGFSDDPSCDPIITTMAVSAGQNIICRITGNPGATLGGNGYSTLTFTIVPPASGACCDPTGVCVIAESASCVGTYMGDTTACEPNPCPQPAGGCCVAAACSVMVEYDCAVAGGAWLGAGLPCLGEEGNPISCCPANVNGAGGVTVQDIFDFLAMWFAGDLAADINVSGDVTVQDIFDFLAKWFAGC